MPDPRLLIVLLLPVLLPIHSLAGELDPVQLDLLRQFELPLRWDNIEGRPLWLDGQPPRVAPLVLESARRDRGDDAGAVFGDDLRSVRLEPGDRVRIRLPRAARLRLERLDGPLARSDLQVGVGNGSGLYHFPSLQQAVGRTSLLLPASLDEERLVHIARPDTAPDALELALFVSRQDTPGTLAPYRTVVEAGTPEDGTDTTVPTVTLRRSNEAGGERFHALTPERPLRLSVRGPVRLALEQRQQLPERAPVAEYGATLQIRLDGRLWQIVETLTRPDTSQPLFVDDCARWLGRAETTYLEIPTGDHELRLETSIPLYLRLLARDSPDYLFPRLNAPERDTPDARDAPAEQRPVESLWELDSGRLDAALGSSDPARRVQAARRLARDNDYRDGGLAGAMALYRLARERPDAPEVATLYRRLYGLHSFYRDLPPAASAGGLRQQQAWFTTPVLLPHEERDRPLVLGADAADAALAFLADGLFTELPSGHAQRYRLPPRTVPSRLRVVVDRSTLEGPAAFSLQFDGAPPQRFVIHPDDAELPIRLDTGMAGLWLLDQRHHGTACGKTAGVADDCIETPPPGASGTARKATTGPLPDTLDAPFASTRIPGPLLAVGYLELPLPVAADELYLRTEHRSLRIALQYRAGRVHQLDEREHEAVRQRLGQDRTLRLLQDQLRGETRHWRATEVAIDAAVLLNHNRPLVRLLQTRARQFRAGVADSPVPLTTPLSAARMDALGNAALHHERQGSWLEALGDWMALARGSRGANRRQALLAVPRVLLRLGEAFLAEQMLRGLVLYGDDPELRSGAIDALTALYTEQNDTDGLLNLLSAVATERPEPERLARLVPLLLASAGPGPALNLGLMLPPEYRPLPELLQASYRLQWWMVFEALLQRLPEIDAALWRGYRAQHRGYYGIARDQWARAGQSGTALIAAMDRGRIIARQLLAADPDQRLQAIADWERWYQAHPGPREWRDADALIIRHAGAATVYAVNLDLYSQSFRALPQQPVTLRIQGPVRLRVRARLLHDAESDRPVDDWLLLQDGATARRTPILADRPSQGLTIAGEPGLLPGRLATLEHELGPGLHEITVHARERELLVEAEIEGPALPLLMLPQPTPSTVLAASLAPDRRLLHTSDLSSGLVTIDQCELQQRQPPSLISAPVLSTPDTDALHRLDRRLRIHRTAFRPKPPDPQDQTRLRLVELLWQIEQQPRRRLDLLPRAEQIFQDHPDQPALQPLMARIRRHTLWQQLDTIELSAGIRLIETDTWQPESPPLRIRQALLPPSEGGALILTGSRQLGLSLFNTEPITLQLELSLLELPFIPPQPLTVAYRLDQGPSRRLTLNHGEPPRSVAVAVAEGEHVLRITPIAPLANQFLRLQVREQGVEQPVALSENLQRRYFIATADEPVETTLTGPAWLRIDEWQDGRSVSRYRAFGPGIHRLVLRPPPGREELLLRLHQRMPDPEAEPPPPRRVVLEPRPVPAVPAPAALSLTLPAPAVAVDLTDAYPLGSQEDGTWGFGAALQRRRSVDDEPSNNLVERFLELHASYLLHQPHHPAWYWGRVLVRRRDEGGPTVGLRASADYRIEPGYRFGPLNLHLAGSLFLQRPDRDTTEWSANLRGSLSQRRDLGPKSWHIPALGFWVYRLSLDDNPFRPGEVDRDVFTRYKAEHRHGLNLSETLYHRPWLDTLWYGGVRLTTNEDLNPLDPDHVQARVGWRQLLGDWQFDAEYRLRRYLADDDRSADSTQHRLRLNLDWNGWEQDQDRWLLHLGWEYDFDRNDSNWLLSIEWYGGAGRGLRDFRPAELDFEDLRWQRIPQTLNNTVEEVDLD